MEIECSHILPCDFDRDQTDLCDIDGCPCDAERRKMCNEKATDKTKEEKP